MASKLDLTNLKFSHAVKHEFSFEFPDFIKQLRLILGRSRKSVAKEVGISYDKLFRLECGNFRVFYKKRIADLSSYYGVDKEVLERKCEAFLQKKKLEAK